MVGEKLCPLPGGGSETVISRTREDAVCLPGLQTKAEAVRCHSQGPGEVGVSEEGAIRGADQAGSGAGAVVL